MRTRGGARSGSRQRGRIDTRVPLYRTRVINKNGAAAYTSGGIDADLRSTYGVELVPDIATLAGTVDAILLESVDGRIPLAQMKEILKAGKPVFIDKPLAASLADAREIARLAEKATVPWFSASALGFRSLITSMKSGDAIGAVIWRQLTCGPAAVRRRCLRSARRRRPGARS